jgi:lysozyme
MNPNVVDISHWTKIRSLAEAYAAGVWGIISKATQGVHYIDKNYAGRREWLGETAPKMLWGAYHFGDSSNTVDQVQFFLEHVGDLAGVCLALDWEDEPGGRTMSVEQAASFVQLVENKTGQLPAIYGGKLLKEQAGPKGHPVLNRCRLWLSHYSDKPKLPPGFEQIWLHQYTGDGVGPLPHTCPGFIGDQLDLNVYDGPVEQLAAEWTTG